MRQHYQLIKEVNTFNETIQNGADTCVHKENERISHRE